MALREYDPAKPLISIHVPKCGGTSFTEFLSGWFWEKFFSHYFDEKNGIMPPRYALLPGICIHGHFNSTRGFGVKDYYTTADQFITVLRDPVEIAISNYFHLKRHRGENYRDGRSFAYENQFCDVNEFLLKHQLPLLSFLPFVVTKESYRELFNKSFVFVGTVECMDTTVHAMAKKLGFLLASIRRENQSARDEAIEPAAKK